MKVAFRVDASSQIGTGHFMRCLTLAEALCQAGVELRFICRHLPDNFQNLLIGKAIDFVQLQSRSCSVVLDELPYSNWLGQTQQQDAVDSLQALADADWDWLIVDHYALDYRWETPLRAVSKNILVIDDLADRSHDCDALLDQNYYSNQDNRYFGLIPNHCRALLGPRYALLRKEFLQIRNILALRSGSVSSLLVFFGGVDLHDYTSRTLEVLSLPEFAGLQIVVVAGSNHPKLAEIQAFCNIHGFILHINTPRMAELMAEADLIIGAGGSTVWERCCLGLPGISLCTADNQQQQISDAAQAGLLYAPEISLHNFAAQMKRHILALIENDNLRIHIAKNAWAVVDGRGVLRVLAVLGCPAIELKPAKAEDSAKLFAWRNHPAIRAVSRNSALIAWADHQQWFTTVLGSSDKILLIGYIGEQAIGVVRFDKTEDWAEISIYLVPDGGFTGLGSNLLRCAEQWLKKHHPEIKGLKATVKGENTVSQKLFSGADYAVEAIHFMKKH